MDRLTNSGSFSGFDTQPNSLLVRPHARATSSCSVDLWDAHQDANSNIWIEARGNIWTIGFNLQSLNSDERPTMPRRLEQPFVVSHR